MADSQIYNPTTAASDAKTKKFGYLTVYETIFKAFEVIFSFIAFVLEEVVTDCNACSKLYFFEFVSCTAFLFTLLLTILLVTKLHTKVGISCWDTLDFGYTFLITISFVIASGAFITDNTGTPLETVAAVFGFLAFVVFLINTVFIVIFRRKDICCFKTKCMQQKTPPEPQPVTPENEKLTIGSNP